MSHKIELLLLVMHYMSSCDQCRVINVRNWKSFSFSVSQPPGVAVTLFPWEEVVFEFKSVVIEETLTFFAFISPSFDP